MEKQLLQAATKKRKAFSELQQLQITDDLSDQGLIYWKFVKEYYDKDKSANTVDQEILLSRIGRQYPKHKGLFKGFLEGIEDASAINIVSEAKTLRQTRLYTALSGAFSAANEEDIGRYLLELSALNRSPEGGDTEDNGLISDISTKELANRSGVKNRIKLWPPSLTEHLGGGVLRGHHIVMYACTDIGKSLMAINLAYGFIRQGLKCLYIGNEDPGEDLLMRFRVRLSGLTSEQILQDPEEADRILGTRKAHNFMLAELSPGTIYEIRGLIKKYTPDCLIVDQIKNLNMGTDFAVEQLEKAAQGVRNLCKEFSMVGISIAQASDSADGKAVLGRGDVYGSNVGIPGSADIMLGIGATYSDESTGIRTLSFAKNKINGKKNPLRIKLDYSKMEVI